MRVGRKPGGNPFSTCHVRPGAIPFQFPRGLDVSELTDRLEAHGWRGQIIGPHGSGKSTLLAALLPELRRRRSVVHVELHQHERRLPEVVWSRPLEPTLLVIDGYEQLGWWAHRRVRYHCQRHGWGLLVTTHRGRRWPELYRTGVTPELAAGIVRGLLANETREPPAGPELARRLSHHRGNLREVLFELYDRYEAERCEACV